ncbi:hypothetical protein EMCRGX_G025618 [Ephydatia muelleri]
MNKHKCNDKLSSLARGRGLLDGGVEIECFTDDISAFSLTGQRLICESNTRGGTYAKPYKPHCLTLPKTYVTRKGQIVLFTAPEDMVLGQACQLHSREVTSRETAHQMKSSQSLVQSALAYGSQKEKEIKVKSKAWMKEEEGSTEKGFQVDLAKVYLNSLQRTAEKARQVPQDHVTVEDMEVVGEIIETGLDRPDSSVDSGLGSCQVSSAQVLSLNSRSQDPTFSSRASKSLLDEPATLGPVEDDLSKLQTKLLDAYQPPSSKINKKSPRKGKKGKSWKTNSKESTLTCTTSTQKDNEQLSNSVSSYSHTKSWVRVGTEDEDSPIGEQSGEFARRASQEEIARRQKDEEIVRRQEEEIARGQIDEEIARRQEEEIARRQKDEEIARRQEEEIARRRKDEEIARRQEEEIARRQKEEEIARRQKEEEIARRQKEEEIARRQKEEEIARRQKEEEIARRQKEEEIARRQKEEEIARRQKEEEIARRQMEAEAQKQRELRLERLKEDEEKRLAVLYAEDKARAERNLRMKAELADLRYSQTLYQIPLPTEVQRMMSKLHVLSPGKIIKVYTN